jgi:hypothetical protein
MFLTAADLKPGVRFKYNGHPVEILRDPEKRKDRFGLELDSWWARRIDTGDEGYVSLGPGGILRVERLKTEHVPSSRRIEHHARKRKSPAQLQREINEVLTRSSSRPKSATVIVYSRPSSGYWYAQAHDATGARITDASGYSREGVLRELRGKFAMIGVTIESITDKDPYQDPQDPHRQGRAHAMKFASQTDRLQRQGSMKAKPHSHTTKNSVNEGRTRDAMRWIAQEARAILHAGKIDERFADRLRAAFKQLDAAYDAAHALPTTLPPAEIAKKSGTGDALAWVAQVVRGLLRAGKIDERYTDRLRDAFEQLGTTHAAE